MSNPYSTQISISPIKVELMNMYFCVVHWGKKIETQFVEQSHASQPTGFFTGSSECNEQGNLVAVTHLFSLNMVGKVLH